MAERVQRRLAAIVAADAVEYSRLVGEDEEGTLRALHAHRTELIDPLLKEHQGRIANTAGDSLLLEFRSVVEAVRCAVAIQRGMVARNSGVTKPSRIRFRIGIHVGDVVADGTDLKGHGVNVAARLESQSEPDGILVSDDAHRQVRDQLDIQWNNGGERSLKNIARPILTWCWSPSGETSARDELSGEALPDLERPSIAVLPFDNFSPDRDQDFFADGIADDLITLLSKLQQLHVIARNSSFAYKGKAAKVQEIAKDLGVRYIVEGSVRRSQGRVRIAAQLIDGRTGGHVWSERYDRDLLDIFSVQDEISQEIVTAMAVKLSPSDQSRLRSVATDNLEAYDTFLRGRDRFWQHSKEGNALAKGLFERAVNLDPNFGPAYAFLAFTHLMDHINRWSASGSALREAHDAAQRGVALDESHPESWVALGNARLWMREHEPAAEAYRQAIALDPNYAVGHAGLGWALNYAGRPEEAIPLIERSMLLDPHYPEWRLHWLGEALFNCRQYEGAAEILRRRLVRRPDSDVSHALLAACLGQLGEVEEARAAWDAALAANPDFSIERRRRILPYKDPAVFDHFLEGLRKAGLIEEQTP